MQTDKRMGPVSSLVLVAMLVVAMFGIAAMQAQNTRPTSINSTWQIKPQVLTTTGAVDVSTLPGGPPPGKDIYLCNMWVSAGATASTISITDKQGTPVGFMQAVPVAANTTFAVVVTGSNDQTCPWFPGGMMITAGNANAISVHASGKWFNGRPLF